MTDAFDSPAGPASTSGAGKPPIKLLLGLAGVAIVGFGILACCGGVGLLAAIAIPAYNQTQHEAMRNELPVNVQAIKQAELSFYDGFEAFVEIEQPVPRAIPSLSKKTSEWRKYSDFDSLGWAPDGPVRGTYWVEIPEDRPDDFVVHGMCDVDEDGLPAHYTATRSIDVTLVTDPRLY